MKKHEITVIGVDFGTDSCRALLVDARDGQTVASAVCEYPRWKRGLYCDPQQNRYRQHPLDYIEAFEQVVREVIGRVGPAVAATVAGLAFDTTASTPVLVGRDGMPLALTPAFADEPDAMFVLWKDHTAAAEACEINAAAAQAEVDFTAYSGGIYSSEWVWAKVLHIVRSNPAVGEAAASWVEHCDWMSGLVTGNTRPETILRSRCAAGHKAMWRAEWGGLPSEKFLAGLDPRLGRFRAHLYTDTCPADVCAGVITPEYARRLGLPATVRVAVGSVDAHVGAVGAGIAPGVLTRIIGTSTCDILVAAPDEIPAAPVRGICGQTDGSVLPGWVGFEAGQSAFGDLYAWFSNLLLWPVGEFAPELREQMAGQTIARLSEQAAALTPDVTAPLALDWFNGRRTPDADANVRGALCGLTLGTTAPMIFRALVEATAYGSRAIIERFRSEGICVRSIRAVGGISQKSPLVMQTLSDVLNMPIEVMECDQACALGAAMFAATVAGVYPDVGSAQQAMGAPVGRCYVPEQGRAALYDRLYDQYLLLGERVANL